MQTYRKSPEIQRKNMQTLISGDISILNSYRQIHHFINQTVYTDNENSMSFHWD